MKLPAPISLTEIAKIIQADIIGDRQLEVGGINEIHRVEKGDLTFVDHPKYYEKALNSAASVIIIDQKVDPPDGKALLLSEDPFHAYQKLAKKYKPFQPSHKPISDSAEIGSNTLIQPNVFVGNNVRIGNNCLIHPNVTIYDNSVIGDNVIIQANAVIGSDAYYFKGEKNDQAKTAYERWHSCGRAVLEDHVEVGAGTTIDRGVSADTFIGEGTKLDNLIHIGHDAVIGKHCLFAGQVGIAGVVEIGDHVTLWGQVGVSKDITIGAGAVVLASSGVSKSLEGGKVYFGAPAIEARKKWKEMAAARHLPELWKKIKSGR